MSSVLVLGSRPHGRETRLQPVDGSAGSALRASVHRAGLRLQRLQPADDQAARHHQVSSGRLEADRARLDLQHCDRISRPVGGGVRPLGRGRRTAPGDVHRRLSLRWRISGRRGRRLRAQPVDPLFRLWRARRRRTRHRLYLTGLHPDQWFPDRPGMATGMAIMGFGGGAFIASPLRSGSWHSFRPRPISASPRPSSFSASSTCSS